MTGVFHNRKLGWLYNNRTKRQASPRRLLGNLASQAGSPPRGIMAVFIHQLFLLAADLMFASALSFLFSAVGCLGLTGLVAYVVVLSFRSGVMQKAQKRISRKKEAVLSTVSSSCVGQTAGKMLGLVGSRGTATGSRRQAPVLEEEYCSDLNLKQLPAGEKKCPTATETLTGSHLSRTDV
uniref:Uncharacterized protein n=1 Tax=Sphaerodactylus townsendi TaxID=933632 RepID=A0ACB8GET2_9SAUR